MIRYPAPLVPGDVVGVTSPSAGVADDLLPRLDVALAHLRSLGLEVRVGDLMADPGVASGPADDRARELTALMTDPAVRAVVPPWGGEVAIDLLGRLDWEALAADPTWLVGYSDVSTLLLPLTLLTGVATLHGQNLMDTPYRVPAPMLPWTDVVTTPAGATIVQGPSTLHRAEGFDRWEDDPEVTEYTLDTPGTWRRIDRAGLDDASSDDAGSDESRAFEATGRLVGGCLETVSHLVGTPYGDVDRFVREHAPEGLVVYLESDGSDSADVTRRLFQLRYAGWFEHAHAVLIGRTRGADLPGWTHDAAARHALGDLGVPVVADVDCGHVPPHLALVNGALATVTSAPDAADPGDRWRLVQRLV